MYCPTQAAEEQEAAIAGRGGVGGLAAEPAGGGYPAGGLTGDSFVIHVDVVLSVVMTVIGSQPYAQPVLLLSAQVHQLSSGIRAFGLLL